jgi:hypothetical protein
VAGIITNIQLWMTWKNIEKFEKHPSAMAMDRSWKTHHEKYVVLELSFVLFGERL